MSERACPGCGLRMPASAAPLGDTYYNTSAECWSLFGEVLNENINMLNMCRDIGFDVRRDPKEPAVSLVSLDLAKADAALAAD